MKKLLFSFLILTIAIIAACNNPFLRKDTGNGGNETPVIILITTAAVTEVRAPAKSATPNTTAHCATDNVTISEVSWSGDPSVFLGSTAYTVSITLTAAENHAFDEGLSATVNGHNAEVTDNTGATVVLSYTFPATLDKAVTDMEVKTQPTLAYNYGDTPDLAGLEVTLTFDDSTTEDVEFDDFDQYGITTIPEYDEPLSRSEHDGEPIEVWCGEIMVQTDALTVNPKPIAITGVTATDREYDGTTTVTLSGGTLVGVESVDSGNVGFTLGSGTMENANAGSGKAVTTGITLTGSAADNYTLTQPAVTVNITTITLTFTIDRTVLSPVDNTANIIISGLISGDGASAVVSLSSPPAGLTVAGTTLTYNGTQAFTNPAQTLNFLANAGSNYTTLSAALTVNIYDGQVNYTGSGYDRRIPVTQANIAAFNTYTTATETRTLGLTRHYKLIENIILITPSVGSSNWTAIGTNTPASAQFVGSFDGQENTISNLTINSTGGYQGMFGYVNGGMVQNVGLVGGSISGGSGDVGGVVGINNSGTVQNCYATGNVSGGGSYVGGVVGFNPRGTVQNCYAAGDVSGGRNVGGVVGNSNSGGTVQNCYATGNVSSSGENAGGVVGYNSSSSTVQNCYATGNVSSSGKDAGGVVGVNDFGSTVQYCYATGNVSGGGENVGGVVGESVNSNNMVQNCVALNPLLRTASDKYNSIARVASVGTLVYNCARNDMIVQYNWDGSTGTNKGIADGLPYPDGFGVDASRYNYAGFWVVTMGFDFTNVWEWNSETNLPILRNMPGNPAQNHTVPSN